MKDEVYCNQWILKIKLINSEKKKLRQWKVEQLFEINLLSWYILTFEPKRKRCFFIIAELLINIWKREHKLMRNRIKRTV